MKGINLVQILQILPILLLSSCNQNMTDYKTDEFNIPPFGSSEIAVSKAELEKEYKETCLKMNETCTNIEEQMNCENLVSIIGVPFCTKKQGEEVSSKDTCTCNDVCNINKLENIKINNLNMGINLLTSEGIAVDQAYAGLKELATKVNFSYSPQSQKPDFAKMEALKIISSMQSGEFIGNINSFQDISSFTKFVFDNPILKEKFLKNLSTRPPIKISESKINYHKLSEGDLISSGDEKYVISKEQETKCITKVGESSCSKNIKEVIEKLNNPAKIEIAYDPATKQKLMMACIAKTNCNEDLRPKTNKREKLNVQFQVSQDFHPSIQEKLPDAIECMKTIPKLPLFATKVKEIYGDLAPEILEKINKAKNSMKLQPFIGRKSTLGKTNMDGVIEINNLNRERTKDGLTGTLFHEWIHNLGFMHKTKPKPDVAYTLGDLVVEMAQKGYCED